MDRIPMVNVTARILDQNGKPVAGARITMRLSTVERYCGLIVPRETSQYTDANGNAALRVWPNELGTEGSEYMVTIGYGDACSSPCGRQGTLSPSMSQRFRVVVPNADCNLFDITDLPPYEQRGSGQVITAEVAAFASQAGNAADRAQNAVDTVAAIRAGTEEIAKTADSAKIAALEAAKEARRSEARARELVEGFDSAASHFQNAVVEQTEKTANRLVANATACVKQAETVALEAMESRSGEVLTEISERGSQVQKAAVEAIISSRENALGEIDDARKKSLEDLREEAELFGEDFEALTERAESAAKRAGCSAAGAANSAAKACLCADRAEKAADRAENAKVEVMDAAKGAKEAHACAHADAICAENAATAAHLDAGKAEAAACAAEKSAEMADCCAKKSCKCAEAALEAREAVAGDREYIEEALPGIEAAIGEKEEQLAAIGKRQEEADRNLDILESRIGGFEELVGREADRAGEAANRAENALSLARGENIDFSWLLQKGAKAGEIIDLPAAYRVGANSLRLSWGGMLMYQNAQYCEVGEPGEMSAKARLLCDISENASMNVWISAPRVSGDLTAAEEKAGRIIEALKGAEERSEAAIAGLEDTLEQIVSGGDIQVARAKAEADRAEREAARVGEMAALAQGANLEAQWLTAAACPRNTLLALPVSYIAGRNCLRLFWGGMCMCQGAQYEEIGEPDTVSRHVKLLVDLPAGAHMNAWSVAAGATGNDLQQKLLEVQKLLERAKEAVDAAEDARDKAIAAAAAAVTGTISTVGSQGAVEGKAEGFFIIDTDVVETTP